MPGSNPRLKLIDVKERKPYIGVVDVGGLVAIGQSGGLELHPWGCKPGDPETPEQVTFDLDPDATEVHARLSLEPDPGQPGQPLVLDGEELEKLEAAEAACRELLPSGVILGGNLKEVQDVDLKAADPADVRQRIAMVPQETVIFAAADSDRILLKFT